MRGDAHVQGSPAALQIEPGETSAAESLVFGPALDTIVAGLGLNITIQVRSMQRQYIGVLLSEGLLLEKTLLFGEYCAKCYVL